MNQIISLLISYFISVLLANGLIVSLSNATPQSRSCQKVNKNSDDVLNTWSKVPGKVGCFFYPSQSGNDVT